VTENISPSRENAIFALFISPLPPILLVTLLFLFGARSEYLPSPFLALGAAVVLQTFYSFICLIVGVPLVLLLHDRLRYRLSWSLLFGGLIATVPWIVVPRPWYIENNPTELLLFGAIFGFGMLGGATYWVLLNRLWVKDRR
jgi:hypothetical protein